MILEETKKKNYKFLCELCIDHQFLVMDVLAQDLEGKTVLHYLISSTYELIDMIEVNNILIF
jgi:hypothetical protein